ASEINDWFYRIEWHAKVRQGNAAQLSLPAEEIARSVHQRLAELTADANHIARLTNAANLLELLSAQYAPEPIPGLGQRLTIGQNFSTSSLMASGNALPRYQKLLLRLLAILAEDGVLTRNLDQWTVLQEPPAAPLILPANESLVSIELALLRRCGPAL